MQNFTIQKWIGWLGMAHNSWILNLIDDNVIGMNGKHIIIII
jgi:hypothetical protein